MCKRGKDIYTFTLLHLTTFRIFAAKPEYRTYESKHNLQLISADLTGALLQDPATLLLAAAAAEVAEVARSRTK